MGSWAFAARRTCGAGGRLLRVSVSDDVVFVGDASGVLGQGASGSLELGFFFWISCSVGSGAPVARKICVIDRGLLIFSVSDDMVVFSDTSVVLGQEASGAPELGVLFGISFLGSWAPAARRIFGADRELLFDCVLHVPEFAIDKPSPSISPRGLIDGFFRRLAPGLIDGDNNVNLRVL